MPDPTKKRVEIKETEEVFETTFPNPSLRDVVTSPPVQPGDTPQGVFKSKEMTLKSLEPASLSVFERTRKVVPRKTVGRFRCAGKWWSTRAGKEMTVPVGVADHMEETGLL